MSLGSMSQLLSGLWEAQAPSLSVLGLEPGTQRSALTKSMLASE